MTIVRGLQVSVTDGSHFFLLLHVSHRLFDLKEFFESTFPHLLQVDQVFTFDLKSSLPCFLSFDSILFQRLYTLLTLDEDVEPVGKRDPLGPINEFFSVLVTPVFIAHNTVVNIDVIHSECAVLFQGLNIKVILVNQTVGLNSLRTRFIIEMVVTFQALVSLNSRLKLKLNLRILGLEAQRHFVDSFRRQREVGPPGKVLMLLVLKSKLLFFVKITYLVFHAFGVRLIADRLQHLLV